MSPSSDRQSAETQKAEKQKVKQKVVSIPCPAENGRDMKRDMGEVNFSVAIALLLSSCIEDNHNRAC